MTTSQIVKLNFLVVGFALSVWAIYTINSNGLPPSLLAIFGLPHPATGTKAAMAREANINLCKTRVQGLIQPEKLKLMQNGNEWIAEKPTPQTVDFIAVEKWLSRFCSSHATAERAHDTSSALEAKAALGNGFVPALFVKFVDGAVDILRADSKGRFEWDGQVFRSSDLAEALAELGTLPEAKSPGANAQGK